MDVLGFAGWLVALVTALGARTWMARQRELVSHACHELRGPITAVRLAVELGLSSGGLSSDRLHAVELELDCAALAVEDLGCAGKGARARPDLELMGLDAVLQQIYHECVARAGERR